MTSAVQALRSLLDDGEQISERTRAAILAQGRGGRRSVPQRTSVAMQHTLPLGAPRLQPAPCALLGFGVPSSRDKRKGDRRSLVGVARDATRRRAWVAAYAAFERADRKARLSADDLETFATAAYMLGRDATYLKTLERAHQAHLEAGARLRSARSAFWLGLRLAFRGETAQASGWFARAERLVEKEDCECPERGYLLLPIAEHALSAGDETAAHAAAAQAAAIAERLRRARLDGHRAPPTVCRLSGSSVR
jgi:hypothetical protein